LNEDERRDDQRRESMMDLIGQPTCQMLSELVVMTVLKKVNKESRVSDSPVDGNTNQVVVRQRSQLPVLFGLPKSVQNATSQSRLNAMETIPTRISFIYIKYQRKYSLQEKCDSLEIPSPYQTRIEKVLRLSETLFQTSC
jgi:hypothetical protein